MQINVKKFTSRIWTWSLPSSSLVTKLRKLLPSSLKICLPLSAEIDCAVVVESPLRFQSNVLSTSWRMKVRSHDFSDGGAIQSIVAWSSSHV
jgi:hypothetical protein